MRKALVALLCLSLGACATVVSGTSQDVEIVSDPPGAECRVMAGSTELARTVAPGIVRLERQEDDLAVQCRLPGHRASGELLRSSQQGITAGNLIVGGMVGLAVDAASGANWRYESPTRIALLPLARPDAGAESWDLLSLRTMSGASLHRQPVGSIVSGTPRLGRVRVPLPPGDWIVAARERGASVGSAFPYARVFLVQPGAGAIDGLILVTTNLGGRGPWARMSECGSRALHHVALVSDRDCWWISHYVRGAPTPQSTSIVTELHEFLQERRLRTPTMMTVGFYLTDSGGFFSAVYAFRPGAARLPDETGMGWSNSRWHATRVASDPRQVQLIDWGKAWAEAMLPAVRAAAKGEPYTVAGLPPPISAAATR